MQRLQFLAALLKGCTRERAPSSASLSSPSPPALIWSTPPHLAHRLVCVPPGSAARSRTLSSSAQK
eukprot:4296420-Pleurochrysis_carterae.AAC.1